MYNRNTYIESDSPIKEYLLNFFNKNTANVILDIGSCEGEDSIKYSKLFPSSRIIAFEPLPDNQKLIYGNLEKYGVKNVEVSPIALSDKKEIAEFHVSSGSPDGSENSDDWNFGNKSSSLLPPDKHKELTPWVKFDNVIKVPTDTLENVCKEFRIEEIDFAHLDVQGAELKVLIGAGSLLQKIKVIWMEVADIHLYKNQPLKKDVEQFMKKSGFILYLNSIEGAAGDQMYINRKYFWLRSLFLDIKKMFSN